MQAIKAIETKFKGYRFRSRLEARWAVCFEKLGLKWEYEKEGYELPSGRYLPDFYLPELKSFVEIKPKPADNVEQRVGQTVYLAGKMNHDWRRGLDVHGMIEVGPNMASRAHDAAIHGTESADGFNQKECVFDCCDRLAKAGIIFCWINHPACYGTLVECGWAWGRNRDIYLGFDRELALTADFSSRGHWNDIEGGDHEFWFLQTISKAHGIFDNAQRAFDHFFPYTPEERKCAELSQINKVLLCNGDPADHECLAFYRGKSFGVRTPAICFSDRRIDEDEFYSAAAASRAARFEFGENG